LRESELTGQNTSGGQGEEEEGEADCPLSRELTRGSIPGPWDHDLSQRQMPN